MLSAVAARKAALAAAQAAATEHVTGPPTPSGSGSNLQVPKTQQSETPKRKPSAQKSRPNAKKAKQSMKKKDRLTDTKKVDSFRNQTDIIIVESDDDDGSDSGMSGVQEEFSFGRSGFETGSKASLKRAWSPSKPLEDSSDEEELPADAEVGNPLDISSLFPNLSRSTRTQPIEDNILSTFEPALEQNIFVLTPEESRIFGLSGKATLVGLHEQDAICLLGTCTLSVLHGSIDLLGTTIAPSLSKYPIYAPRSSPLPVLRAGGETSFSILEPDTLPPRFQKLLQYRAVLALQDLKSGIEGLGRICRTFEGVFEPSRWQKNNIDTPFDVSGLYMVRRQTKECTPFSLPSSWSAALDALSTNNNGLGGSYIVKGPKNSGKSAFARTLTNHLLKTYQKVAFLECDLGQSEFTPGGMVSLNVISSPILGPPFTHPTLPNSAHFIGSTTPRSSPSHYIDSINALIQTYRLDVQTPTSEVEMDVVDNDHDSRIADIIPIVVNTMGWSKGLGADLTQRIESMLEPTDIFDIQPPTREEYPVSVTPLPTHSSHGSQYGAYYDQSTMDATTARIHSLDNVLSILSSASTYTPADHRALAILSYFHARFPSIASPLGLLQQVTAVSWDTSRPLCAEIPYSVECGVAFDRVVLTGAGSEDVVEEEISRVLNGAIIGLVKCDPGTMDLDKEENGKGNNLFGIPYIRHHGPPSPLSSTCVGIALVRGVSPPISIPVDVSPQGQSGTIMKTYLQLLTPLPHSLLALSRVLVKGEMELPVWGMLDFRSFEDKENKGVDMGDVAGVESENVPFLQWGKAPDGALGAEKRRVRRNLMRRGQM